MSLAAVPLPAPGTLVPSEVAADRRAWADWLAGRIDPDWRPGEWRQEGWLFTGDHTNPKTGLKTCAVHACDVVIEGEPKHWNRVRATCKHCHPAMAASELSAEEFLASYIPARERASPHVSPGPCTIISGDLACGYEQSSRGICAHHYQQLIKWTRRRGLDFTTDLGLAEWIASGPGVYYTDRTLCLVPCCDTLAYTPRGLCRYHYGRWQRASDWDDDHPPSEDHHATRAWALRQTPFLDIRRFSLLPLRPVVRLELLYAIQQGDRGHKPLPPAQIRPVIKKLELEQFDTLVGQKDAVLRLVRKTNHAIVRQLCWFIDLGADELRGVAAIDKDVVDLRAIGLRTKNLKAPRRLPGTADLTQIHQPWLRDLVRRWMEAERPSSYKFRARLRAAVLASQALHHRPGGGLEQESLGLVDAQAVFDGIRVSNRLDGTAYGNKHRHDLLREFWLLIDHGRRADLLVQVPGNFAKHSSHAIRPDIASDDESGSAVPESVIRQLDTALDLLGDGYSYGRMAADLVQKMFQTIYIVMRDTGRRPLEIAALARDCLEADGDNVSLVWDNRKGRRLRRRLPIEQETATAIRSWQAIREQMVVHSRSEPYLFPAISHDAAEPHMDSSQLSSSLRHWMTLIPRLDGEDLGEDGRLLPFDRSRIFPYAFRHSYAQRHADAGTPIDVLKELMDHVNVDTTMKYYKVSLKRKRAAVKTLTGLVVDRSGTPAPFNSETAYERSSVAVPFGGCVEPSNVRAGGHACPIRFQCAGCGFYRPDPSYLPAIEQHINELKADRETAMAMDAAEFVITGMTEQIIAFANVAATMKRRLAELPADERAEIEEAAIVLRKTRAATGHKLLPLTIKGGQP